MIETAGTTGGTYKYGGEPGPSAYVPREEVSRVEPEEELVVADPTKARDLGWAIAWIVAFLVMIGLGINGVINYASVSGDTLGFILRPLQLVPSWAWVLAFITPLVLVLLFFVMIRYATQKTVVGSLLLNPVLFAGLGIWSGEWVYYAIAAVYVIYLIFTWSKIPFTVAVLKTGLRAFDQFKLPLLVHLVSAIVVAGAWIICIYAIVGTFALLNNVGDHLITFMFLLMLLFSYWIVAVIANVAFTVSSGVLASWFFSSANEQEADFSGVTLGAFKRAVTTSFGSICLGSLVSALARLLHTMCKSGGCRCIAGLFKDLIDYLNSYVYVQVAVYGKPYMVAAKDTFKVFSKHGMTVIINDSMVESLFNIFSFATAFLSSFITIVSIPEADRDILTVLLLNLVIVLFVWMIVSSVCSVIVAFTRTAVVCWLEHPEQLIKTNPKSYWQLVDACKKKGYNLQWLPVAQQQNQV